MRLQLRCRCGKLQGEVDARRVAARAICYCKDCQAFARFLAPDGSLLDASGGTEVEATLPAGVRFTQGLEHLACMSLSPQGIYRWYASCCNTPVGNTPRNPAMPYVGLVRACLAATADTLDRELGRARMTASRFGLRADQCDAGGDAAGRGEDRRRAGEGALVGQLAR